MIAAALLLARAAMGAEPRFCPNRPDLGTSNCTTEPGRVLVEGSGIDWTRSEDAATQEDAVLAGDVLVRFGLTANTEAQVGWTTWGRVRTRDKATGSVARVEGPGDVRLAIRRNFAGQDGGRLGLALEPFVTVPVGRAGVDADD